MWITAVGAIFFGCAGAIIYTYVVYPALAALIGGTRDKQEIDILPGISVLVPAFNEAEVIEAKIDNFLELDYPSDRIEMVIVDDGSSDNTREIIERRLESDIRLLDPAPRAGKASGLNRMVESARHPFLLLCDANVMFASDAAKRLAQHMQRPEVGAVTGEVRLVGSTDEFEAGESLYYVLERRIQGAESRLGSVMGVDGGMYLLRKDLFQPLPPDTILDDFVISMQVMRGGHRIVYDCDIKATESGTPSSQQEFKRRVRMMAGVVQMLRRGMVPRWTQPMLWCQFISHKLLRWVTPLLLVGVLASNVVLLGQGRFFVASFATQLAMYAFFVLTVLVPGLRSTRGGSIVFYFFMSQVAIVLGLCKGILNRQRVLWEKGKRADSPVVTAR